MAKKKNSNPILLPLASVTPEAYKTPVTVSTNQIEQIPPYPDGFQQSTRLVKRKIGDQYELIRQLTRFYSAAYNNVPSPTTEIIPRANKSTHIFYCTGILVQISGSSNGLTKYCDLWDGDASNPKFRVFFWGSATATNNESFFLDLKDCPRMFADDIKVDFPNGASSSVYIHIELFGWDEPI